MNKHSLERMLEFWARFYHYYDFGGLGYPHSSNMKPIIRSTLPRDESKIPYDVEQIDIALIQLTPRQRQIINAEYQKKGHYKAKAQTLNITFSCYRSTLNHAKSRLLDII